MHVSKEIDFGIRLVMILAKGPQPATDLAEKYQIPHNFVQLILPKLVRAGMVNLVPKSKNVHELAKDPASISMLDVLNILNGPIDLMSRHYAKSHATDEFFSPMLDVWHGIEQDVAQKLAEQKISDLLRE